MDPYVICLLVTILIIEIVILVLILVYHNILNNTCSVSSSHSNFSNPSTLSIEDIDKMWEITGCPNQLNTNIKNELMRLPSDRAALMISNYARRMNYCGRQFFTKCKDIMTSVQLNELQQLWRQHKTCKNLIFPRCYLNSYYKGLPYSEIKLKFINEFMNDICP
jgi:hypothetical protein